MEVARLELGKRAGMLVEKRLGQEAALNKLEKDRIELRKQVVFKEMFLVALPASICQSFERNQTDQYRWSGR